MELLDLDELLKAAQPYVQRPSVYFLFSGEKLVYIGSSAQPEQRINQHGKGKWRKNFDSFSIVRVPNGVDMQELEHAYIARLKPPINKVVLFPSDFGPPKSEGTPLERAMKRISQGQTPYSAAKAEGIDPQRIYGTKAYRSWKDEADKLLLQSRNAEPSKEGFRNHWNAGLRIHQARSRFGIEENEALK